MAWSTPSTVTFGSKATSAKWNELVNDLKYLKGQDGPILLENYIQMGSAPVRWRGDTNGAQIDSNNSGHVLHWFGTGIALAANIIVPDGAGDVTQLCWFEGILYNESTAAAASFASYPIAHKPGTGSVIYGPDGSGNSVRVDVLANGSVTIYRSAGPHTFAAYLHLMWR